MNVPGRWEWRTFGASFGAAERRLAAHPAKPAEHSTDIYVLSPASDASVKLRDGLVDVKHLVDVDDDGLEQWRPVKKAAFPLPAADVAAVLASLGAAIPPLQNDLYTLDEASALLTAARPRLRPVAVRKSRVRYTLGGCMAELSEFETDDATTRTLAVEGEDPARVMAVLRQLGLASLPNTCVARGLKALLEIGGPPFAVIDVGTNSVKFYVGERGPDGSWRTIVDRAEVTRLGEGFATSGRLSPDAIARTADAIAGMAAEADRHEVEAIAAVGTAGLRQAPNADELVIAARTRAGVRLEVISGEEEARLAYCAATAGVGRTSGSLVVFDTGGGSSQFTFGDSEAVHTRFSVNVGAVAFSERFGLDGVTSPERLEAALGTIAGALAGLAGRPVPDTVIGMGGAITNLAAVKLGLAVYDPDAIRGAVLDRDDIDRQIELYRGRDALSRRAIVGLQSNRAEVILAGACIVRTILATLGVDSLIVSDRGLRHQLLAERFTEPSPSGAGAAPARTASPPLPA